MIKISALGENVGQSWDHRLKISMFNIFIWTVFLATVAVASAAICCSQNDGKIGATEKASNSKTIRVPKSAITTSVLKPKIEPTVQRLQASFIILLYR